MKVSQQVKSNQVKERKTVLVNFKGKVPKSLNRVKNLSIEFHGKAPLTAEEHMLDLGCVCTSEQLIFVHTNMVTFCFQNGKVWLNRLVSFFSRT